MSHEIVGTITMATGINYYIEAYKQEMVTVREGFNYYTEEYKQEFVPFYQVIKSLYSFVALGGWRAVHVEFKVDGFARYRRHH